MISCNTGVSTVSSDRYSKFVEFDYPEPTIFVGSDHDCKTPAEAALIVVDGDIVLIEPGIYTDTTVWNADNLIILGSRDGIVHMDASGVVIPNQKAIWVIRGRNTIIDKIEFSNAAVPDLNGSGIRQEGDNLIVRNCFFHHNEMGILAGNNEDSEIVVEHSEFSFHGKSNGGFCHNIYINHINKFIFRFNFSHDAEYGHTVKSRANENHIMYNKIMDGENGYSSYLIDLPNGGLSYIVGNVLHQGSLSENSTMVSYGAEGAINPSQELYICNNTFVNDRSSSRAIRIAANPSDVKIVNNIFDNLTSAVVNESGDFFNNLENNNSSFEDRDGYDFRLKEDSPAVDSGMNTLLVDGENIVPGWEYLDERDKKKRAVDSIIDIGAFEF